MARTVSRLRRPSCLLSRPRARVNGDTAHFEWASPRKTSGLTQTGPAALPAEYGQVGMFRTLHGIHRSVPPENRRRSKTEHPIPGARRPDIQAESGLDGAR